MSFRLVAVVLGVLAFVGLIVLAVIGFTPAIAPLVTFAVLALFVGGGNLLGGPRQGSQQRGGQ